MPSWKIDAGRESGANRVTASWMRGLAYSSHSSRPDVLLAIGARPERSATRALWCRALTWRGEARRHDSTILLRLYERDDAKILAMPVRRDRQIGGCWRLSNRARRLQPSHDAGVLQRPLRVLAARHVDDEVILGDREDELGAFLGRQSLTGRRHVDRSVRDLRRDIERWFGRLCRLRERPLDRAFVAADEFTRAVHHQLRRVDRIEIESKAVLLLSRRVLLRAKRIFPALVIPIRDVLAERNDEDALDRLLLQPHFQQAVRGWAAAAAFGREELGDHRNPIRRGLRAGQARGTQQD